MNKIELLLPAGNWDLLKAAINNGADAVYLGVKEFNARRRADNFELDELDKVVLYAHERGVKVYCTLNILIKNSEITKFFETLKQIYLAGTDAIIIQDIALLNIIKETFPEMEVHISTQAGINNTNFLELVKNADRIILPRELSSDEIKKLSGKKDAEIFIHGAQCFSYSGKCLFSSCLGGRSGNRGLCAQPCRKKYNGEYLLSMKDLCLAKKIPEIIEMGIVSLKIEGRVRSINYVEAAAKFYRSAIDSYYKRDFKLNNELFKELELAFNRGFTQGYYSKEKEIISSDSGKSRGLFLGTIREDGQIKLEEDIEIDDGIGIWLKNRIDGAIIKRIENRRTQVDFAKKGETVNIFIRANPETNIYKTSTLKRPKRINFEKNKPIENEKRKLEDIKSKIFEIKETNNTISKKELLVRVHSKTDGLEAIKTGADHVFYNIFEHDFEEKFGAYIPIILNDEEIKQAIELIEKHQIKDILVGNLGAYAALKSNKELNLYLDYSNNVFNDLDLEYYKKYENTTPIISPELSLKDLKQFQNNKFGVMVHGRIVLMNTKYQKLPKTLTDEKKYTFPVRQEATRTKTHTNYYYQILNSVELGLLERINELFKLNINTIFLDLTQNIAHTTKLYRNILDRKITEIKKEQKKQFTKGHWDKGVI